jgi:glycosyltransferase involved in cell wall biosynthesis
MKLDCLVATINMFDKNHNIFTALRNQSFKDFRVIIVHQGPAKFDFTMVEGLNYKYIHIDTLGLSAARNIGIKLSDSDFLSILDDDAWVAENYIQKLVDKFTTNTFSCICGLIIDPITNKPLARSIKKVSSFKMGAHNYNYFMSSAVTVTTNLAKSIFFDELLGVGSIYGGSEEMDFFLRIVKNNDVIFDPDLIVYHPSDRDKMKKMSLFEIFKRGFLYGAGRGAVYKKHLYSRKIFYLFSFLKSICSILLILILDLFLLNLHFFLRDIGSLSGRIFGFFTFPKRI